MISKYWYDATTGEILHRTDTNGLKTFDMPYFEHESVGFNWSNYCIDITTGKLVEQENTVGQGVNPRA